jgi:hypothetical protein
MKRGRVTSAILAAIAAGTLGITLTASASPSSAAKATATASKVNVVIINCENKAQVKPRDFVLTCADGNSALESLSWIGWTPELASATGTLVQNDCIPYCAAGHFHKYPVIAVLWRPVGYGHSHGVRFSELTMMFPGARPRIYNGHNWVEGPRVVTSSLWPPY